MYSTAVGAAWERIMTGTLSMAASMLGKGTNRLTEKPGSGSRRSVASVMTPSVPSDPINRSLRL